VNVPARGARPRLASSAHVNGTTASDLQGATITLDACQTQVFNCQDANVEQESSQEAQSSTSGSLSFARSSW
jgi:hypothetical protein